MTPEDGKCGYAGTTRRYHRAIKGLQATPEQEPFPNWALGLFGKG